MRSALLLVLAACGSAPVAPAPSGTRVPWPAIVDSHVHLTLYPVDAELVKTGVLYAVDLAAPMRALRAPTALRGIARSGPMLTHVDGYPLDAWGSDGYGTGCDTEACVISTVDALAAGGAKLVKIAMDDDGLDPKLVGVAIRAAHAKQLRVAVHALSDASVNLAGREQADLLAHTPVQPLSAQTIALWKTGAVVSTLAAFGGDASAVENLRALRAAGTTLLYGTDLGNLQDVGPSRAEIDLLRKAGMDDAAIVDAMTTIPLRYWGFDAAPALVLDGDPRTNLRFLLAPREIL